MGCGPFGNMRPSIILLLLLLLLLSLLLLNGDFTAWLGFVVVVWHGIITYFLTMVVHDYISI